MWVRLALWLAMLVAAVAGARQGLAQTCAPVVGEVVSLEGEVVVQAGDEAIWRAAELHDPLCASYTIRTGRHSRAAVALINEAVLRLDQETTIRLAQVAEAASEPSLVSLILGAFQSFSRSPRRVNVDTAYMNLAIRGTEFVVRATADRSLLTVLEGEVVAENPQGRAGRAAGQLGRRPPPASRRAPTRSCARAMRRNGPCSTRRFWRAAKASPARPAALSRRGPALGAGRDERRRSGGARGRAGCRRPCAGAAPACCPSAPVGRVEEADAAIDRGLALDPKAGLGHALRGVIDVVRNRRAEALREHAPRWRSVPTRRRPRSRTPMPSRRASISRVPRTTCSRPRRASRTTRSPGRGWPSSGWPWATVIGHGRRPTGPRPSIPARRGCRSCAGSPSLRPSAPARRAPPSSGRSPSTRPILCHGSAWGSPPSATATLWPAAGTSTWRSALDSSNALLRTYLGKAYFEEERSTLAGEQLAIAKELDPQDPTAYLYDAIRKQTRQPPDRGPRRPRALDRAQ